MKWRYGNGISTQIMIICFGDQACIALDTRVSIISERFGMDFIMRFDNDWNYAEYEPSFSLSWSLRGFILCALFYYL